LLADLGTVEDHFKRALDAYRDFLRTLDRAWTHLAYGAFLRRTRRRVDVCEHLRTALPLFEELHAARFADRAARELRASGETARRGDADTAVTALAPTERQVARLVSQGLANRDRLGWQ